MLESNWAVCIWHQHYWQVLEQCVKLPSGHKNFPKILCNQQLFTMYYSHHQYLQDPISPLLQLQLNRVATLSLELTYKEHSWNQMKDTPHQCLLINTSSNRNPKFRPCKILRWEVPEPPHDILNIPWSYTFKSMKFVRMAVFWVVALCRVV